MFSSGFCITDEHGKPQECFRCSLRDDMAKWMNKMGLAAINFNVDDSKIAGFHKPIIESGEDSPATTPIFGSPVLLNAKQRLIARIGSAGGSDTESDKDSILSWHKSVSHNSSISDINSIKDKVSIQNEKQNIYITNSVSFAYSVTEYAE